jgi:hypothetical protein
VLKPSFEAAAYLSMIHALGWDGPDWHEHCYVKIPDHKLGAMLKCAENSREPDVEVPPSYEWLELGVLDSQIFAGGIIRYCIYSLAWPLRACGVLNVFREGHPCKGCAPKSAPPSQEEANQLSVVEH